MKKAFLAIAIIGFGMVAHAASIVWGSANPLASVSASPSGGTLSNYVAYLCVGGSDVAQNTLASIRSGSWASSDISINLSNTGFVTQTTSVLGGTFTPGTVYEFFVVIFDEGQKNVMISSAQEGTPYDESGTDPASKVVWTKDQLKGTTDWVSATSVPEPTVLALLALGVAGLALKRRVA